MLKIIRDQIQRLLDDIDSGNTNASEEELIGIADTINKILYKPQDMSKYAACQYLNVSRATFDSYIREGKLPKGKHVIGFKELRWDKKELDECIKNIRQHST